MADPKRRSANDAGDPVCQAFSLTESHRVENQAKMLDYGYEIILGYGSVAEAVHEVTQALKSKGFDVLTRIDVAQALKQEIDAEFPEYVILGACNPVLAHRALSEDSNIGLLLPCNVVVQRCSGGEVAVAIADPLALFSIVDNPAMSVIVEEAEARLRRVRAALQLQSSCNQVGQP